MIGLQIMLKISDNQALGRTAPNKMSQHDRYYDTYVTSATNGASQYARK